MVRMERMILSWSVTNSMEADVAVACMRDSLSRHEKPEIIISDKCSQFTGAECGFDQILANVKTLDEQQGPGHRQRVHRTVLPQHQVREGILGGAVEWKTPV